MKKLLILLFWGLSFVQQALAVDSLVSMIWGDDLPSRARRLRVSLPYEFGNYQERKKRGFSLKTLDLSPARLAEHERRFEEARNLEERGDNDGALRLYLALVEDWDLNSSRKLASVCARGGLGLRKNGRLIGLFLDRSAFLRQELAIRESLTKFYEAHGYYRSPWEAAERGMPPPRVVPSEEDVEIWMEQTHRGLGWTEEEARAWLYSGLPAGESARLPTAAEASAASGGGSSEGTGSHEVVLEELRPQDSVHSDLPAGDAPMLVHFHVPCSSASAEASSAIAEGSSSGGSEPIYIPMSSALEEIVDHDSDSEFEQHSGESHPLLGSGDTSWDGLRKRR